MGLYVLGVLSYIIISDMFVLIPIIHLRIIGTLKIVLLYGCRYLLKLINLKLQIVKIAARLYMEVYVNIVGQNIKRYKDGDYYKNPERV